MSESRPSADRFRAMLTNQALKEKYLSLLRAFSGEGKAPLSVHDVIHCNHKPHPYMVGSRHVAHASDHCGGMLGEATMRAIPCAWRGCREPFDAHTSDRVLVLQLTRDASQEEVHAQLKALADTLTADGLDGITFLKSAYHFMKEEVPC